MPGRKEELQVHIKRSGRREKNRRKVGKMKTRKKTRERKVGKKKKEKVKVLLRIINRNWDRYGGIWEKKIKGKRTVTDRDNKKRRKKRKEMKRKK